MTTPRQVPKGPAQTHPVWAAIQSGEVDKLRQIEESDRNWNTFTDHNINNIKLRYLPITPFGAAIYYGKLAVVRYLLEEKGIDFLDKTRGVFEFMAEAIRLGHLNVLKYFIKKFNPVLDNQLLNIAIFSGQVSIAQYLVYEKFLRLKPFRKEKKTQDHLIEELIKRNHFAVLKWLVDEQLFSLNDNAFILACEYGSLDMLKWVQAKIKTPLLFDAKNIEQSPMYRARAGGKLESHQYLSIHKIGPAYDWISLGELPSDIAMRIGDFLSPNTIFNSVRMTCTPLAKLIKHPDFIAHQYSHYFALLRDNILFEDFSQHAMFKNKHAKVIIACVTEDLDSFIKLSIPQDKEDYFGYSDKKIAAKKAEKEKESHEFLLQVFAESYPVTDSDEYFYSFLRRTHRTLCLAYFAENFLKYFPQEAQFLYASRFGRIDILKRLLEENPALLNKHDDKKATALMWAARHDDVEIVKYLLEKATDLNTGEYSYVDEEKKETALDWAIKNQAVRTLPILLKAYAEKAPNRQHAIPSPIVYAVEKNWVAVINVLLEDDPSVLSRKNAKGQNLLESAVSHGYASTVEVLLQHASLQWYRQHSAMTHDSQHYAEALLDLAFHEVRPSTFKALTRFILIEEKQMICEPYFALLTTVLAKLEIKIASLLAKQKQFVSSNSVALAHISKNLKIIKQALENGYISNGEALKTMLILIMQEYMRMFREPEYKEAEDFLDLILEDKWIKKIVTSKFHPLSNHWSILFDIRDCYFDFFHDTEQQLKDYQQLSPAMPKPR